MYAKFSREASEHEVLAGTTGHIPTAADASFIDSRRNNLWRNDLPRNCSRLAEFLFTSLLLQWYKWNLIKYWATLKRIFRGVTF